MKRTEPRPGEMTIRHTTEQTGHSDTFAVCPENFDPSILAMLPDMERRAFGGYRLRVHRAADAGDTDVISFEVVREHDGAALTSNRAELAAAAVLLTTSILRPMDDREAMLLADLEQCAALSLLGVGY